MSRREFRPGDKLVDAVDGVLATLSAGDFREAGAEAIPGYSRTKTIWLNLSDSPAGDPFAMR